MFRFYLSSTGPEDWRQALASPDTQWRSGYSAKEMAYRWEAAGGFPAEIASLLADHVEFAAIEPVHIQVHQVGSEIIRLRDAGEHEKARTLCTTLLELKDRVLTQLDALQRAVLREQKTAGQAISGTAHAQSQTV